MTDAGDWIELANAARMTVAGCSCPAYLDVLLMEEPDGEIVIGPVVDVVVQHDEGCLLLRQPEAGQ